MSGAAGRHYPDGRQRDVRRVERLGYTVDQFGDGFQIPRTWSGVILLGLLGVPLSVLFRLVEHRVLDGNPGSRDQLTTRGDPRFTGLRGQAYAQIQNAKQEGRTR